MRKRGNYGKLGAASHRDGLLIMVNPRMGLRGQKGAAHFEMIIAFVFFISFVFFLFLTLKPYNTTTLTGAVINGMHDSFRDEVNTNLTNVFLNADYSAENPSAPIAPRGCVYVNLPNDVFAYGLTNTVTRDIEDNELNSNLEETGELDLSNDALDYYKVSISPEFEDDGNQDCDPVNDYVVGSVLEREVISYQSLVDMKFRYNTSDSSYESLKSDLRVPSVFDFAITTNDVPDVSMTRQIPDSGDVVANEYVMEVLYPNGTVVNARFTMIVW